MHPRQNCGFSRLRVHAREIIDIRLSLSGHLYDLLKYAFLKNTLPVGVRATGGVFFHRRDERPVDLSVAERRRAVAGTVAYLPRRGRNKPAQGTALDDRGRRGTLALKGRYNLQFVCNALSGLMCHDDPCHSGRCPGLVCSGPFGADIGDRLGRLFRRSAADKSTGRLARWMLTLVATKRPDEKTFYSPIPCQGQWLRGSPI